MDSIIAKQLQKTINPTQAMILRIKDFELVKLHLNVFLLPLIHQFHLRLRGDKFL